jgi:hypothetical protein
MPSYPCIALFFSIFDFQLLFSNQQSISYGCCAKGCIVVNWDSFEAPSLFSPAALAIASIASAATSSIAGAELRQDILSVHTAGFY